MPQLSNNMKTQDILTSSILISQLVSNNFDIANAKNNTITQNLFSNSTQNMQTSIFMPKVNSNGTLEAASSIDCDDQYCNNKGYCVQISSYQRFCKCLPNYSGSNCQVSAENKQTFDNLANNITAIIKNQIKNNTFDNTLSVKNNIFESLKLVSLSVSKMNPVTSQISDLVDSLGLLTQNKSSSLQNSILVVNNNQTIFDTIDVLFQTSLFLSEKQKYENIESDFKSGKINSTAVNVIPIDMNKTNVTSFSGLYTNPKKRKLYLEETLSLSEFIISKSVNFAKENMKNNQRNLQANSSNYVLEVIDQKLLALTQDQYQEYKQIYEKIKNIFDFVNNAILTVNKRNSIEIYKFNNFYEYYISTIKDLNNYDFKKFFEQRQLKNLSYFDATACLKNITSRKQTVTNYDYSTIYFIFFNYYYPLFNYDPKLQSNSISLSYFIKFYDANATEIIINDCIDNIIHYIPIYPNNLNFIKSYNLYPDKWYQTARTLPSKSYMPFFISTKGEIDTKNSLETQKNLYYRDYSINLTYYDQYLSTYTSNKNNKFQYTNRNGYSIATTNSTGQEIALFAYYDPPTQKLTNTYFINYNEIFTNSKNYMSITNYILFALLFVFVLSFILLVILKNVVRKFNNYYEWNNYEDRIREKDNIAFGTNRAGYYENLNRGYDLNINENIKDKDSQCEKDDDGNNNENSIARNKFKKLKKEEDQENNEEEKDDSKRDEGRVVIKDIEMIGMQRVNILEDEEVENDDNNPNLHTAKLRVTTTNQLKTENKNSSNKKDNYSNIFYKNKNLKDFNNIKSNPRKRCYNIFYFICKRNIYVNLFTLSSPFDPKYKQICKFALFIFLQFLLTSVLFIFSQLNFSVSLYFKNWFSFLYKILKIFFISQ